MTLCYLMDCSTSGFLVLHHLPEFAQIHVHWGGDAIHPSHPLSFTSPPAFNPSPASGYFPVSQLLASGGQSIGASTWASVPLMNIQNRFLSGLNNWLGLLAVQFSSVQSLSRVQLFATPWTAARQASLSITNSWSLLKLMSIELVMPSSVLTLCRLSLFPIFPHLFATKWWGHIPSF